MTTILATTAGMAGDGMISQGGKILSYEAVKVVRLANGCIAGFAGSSYLWPQFQQWLNDRTKPLPACNRNDAEILVLSDEGACLCYDGFGNSFPISLPTAIGSGAVAALAAHYAGASLVKAIEIASRLDNQTGGKITHLEFLP